MDLDEIRAKWAEQDRKIEANLRVNQQLLKVTYLDKTQSALQRLVVGLVVEAIIHFPLLLWLGSFNYEHRGEMRFFLPGVGLHLFVIAGFISLIRQIVLASRIDYSGPIAAIQKQLETLRVSRIRLTQRVFLTAPLVWVPLLIVGMKGLFGLDAYQLLGATYLWANVGFGVAFIPMAFWLSRKFMDRMGHLPMVQQIMRDLAGSSLTEAFGYLETLADFEKE